MGAADERLQAAEVAMGNRSADVILLGGSIVEVHNGQVQPSDVAICGPRVAAVGDVSHCLGPDTESIDCSGLILVPGFIDPHFHIGGSQLTIERLAEVLVPRGTAALCTDFYEGGVVVGKVAVEEQLNRAEGTGLAILLSPFHSSALGFGEFGNPGRFSLQDLMDLGQLEASVEIREWNYRMSQLPMPELRRYYEAALDGRRVIGGHLEGLTGPPLQASVALGVSTDHEASTTEQAIEMTSLGVVLQIREGSGVRDFGKVVPAITEHGADPRCFSISSDEIELHALARDGHMDHKLRLAVSLGVPPVEAVRMVTLNAAASLGVQRDYGSIAPGKIASIAAVADLRAFRVELMLSRGELSARGGSYLLRPEIVPYPSSWSDTINVERELTADDFLFDRSLNSPTVRVIGSTPGSVTTTELVEQVHLNEGRLHNAGTGLAKIAVVDRYDGGHRVGLGLIRGLEIRRGALAATSNPSLMNLMVVGINEEDMALAANRIVELGGGTVVASGGEIRAELPTPVFGNLSHAPSHEAIKDSLKVVAAIVDHLGSPHEDIPMVAGLACLAVAIPELKICDRGLVRVSRAKGQEAVSLYVDDNEFRAR